jgi:hypothetical protein
MVRAGRLVTTPGRAALSSCATGLRRLWYGSSTLCSFKSAWVHATPLLGRRGLRDTVRLSRRLTAALQVVVRVARCTHTLGQEHGEHLAEGVG